MPNGALGESFFYMDFTTREMAAARLEELEKLHAKFGVTEE